jgi:hypothetical protein
MAIVEGHFRGAGVGPFQDEAPLIVDADRVEACEVSLESFEAVTGWDCHLGVSSLKGGIASAPVEGNVIADKAVPRFVVGKPSAISHEGLVICEACGGSTKGRCLKGPDPIFVSESNLSRERTN